MAADLVSNINGMTVMLGPLQTFTRQNSFADYTNSSFPVFGLAPEVSQTDIQQAADAFNQQAQAELGFEDSELREMGYPAVVPPEWQLHDRSAQDVVRWYHEEFSKAGNRNDDDPQWYPIGFLGISSRDWKQTGVVLVFYDARSQHPENEPVTVNAFVADSQKVGAALISLRQGDDEWSNIKEHSHRRD